METIKTSVDTSSRENSCCAPTVEAPKVNDPCCEQPTDGSSCCDKTESKSVNSEKTGCC